ncbi:MAG: hypothetical protein L3K17_00920 [Thermoplasmata archaeon]|nr:hypothetical protein [Thermoplasmata archaeon]
MNPNIALLEAARATDGGRGIAVGWMRGRARALARTGKLAGPVLVACVLLLSGPAWGHPPAPSNASPPAAASRPFSIGGCGGAQVDPNITGTLSVVGGPYPPPSVVNQTIEVAFDYLQNSSVNGQPPLFQCLKANVTAITGAGGAFSADMTLQASGCNGRACVYYTGPFDPVSLGVAGAPPSGYFVTSSLVGTTAQVHLVAALDSATLTPFGRTTVSVLAPVTLTAAGLAGDGSPSPSTLAFNWTVVGTGWSIISGRGTPTLVVDSSTGAALGTVTVYVNGTYGSATQQAPSQDAILTAAATMATAGNLVPTSLDEGTPAAFTVNGTGAGGYAYIAHFAPGLGATDVTAPCSATPVNGGYVALSCTAQVTYPDTGTAQPTAALTNGYSSSTPYAYPSVSVAAPLGFFVSPQPDLAYAGTRTTIVVTAETGTGTAPLGPACDLPDPLGVLTCVAGGPTWTFHPVYANPGTFDGYVTVADHAGANVTVPTAAIVAPRPTLTPFPESGANVPSGASYPLTSLYGGGALPATYWWNDSTPSSTLASGSLLTDGPLDFTFLSTTTGRHTLTLTVIDGLGTVIAQSFNATVTAGPAVGIQLGAGSASGSATAGKPYSLSWEATGSDGRPTTLGAGAFTITVASGSPGTLAWVNDSDGGTVLPNAAGQFVLDAGAWNRGYLNFTVVADRAGLVVLDFASGVPISGVPGGMLALTVVPDLSDLHLFDPAGSSAGNGADDTRWQIADRFLNPLTSGFVRVVTDLGGVSSSNASNVQPGPNGSFVWVNYTVPFGTGGTVQVLNPWGVNATVLLWTLSIAGPASVSLLALTLPFGLLAVAVLCLAIAIRGRRPAPAAPVSSGAPSSGEDELMRLAQGRAHVLARSDAEEPRELADLARGWTGRPPDPGELTEWVSSLVAEGALTARVGPDGKPRFLRSPPGAPAPTEAPPKIQIDAAALDAALAHRDEPEPAPSEGEDRSD